MCVPREGREKKQNTFWLKYTSVEGEFPNVFFFAGDPLGAMRVDPTCLPGRAVFVRLRANLCVAPSVPVPRALCFVLCCTLLPATVVARVLLSLCSLRAARRCTRARIGAWRRRLVDDAHIDPSRPW